MRKTLIALLLSIGVCITGCSESQETELIDFPEYQIIEMVGESHADILVPIFSNDTPIETLETAAYAIQKKEKLRTLAFFTSIEAQKAVYSDSYAEKNPDARNGHIGGISFETGVFSKAEHISLEKPVLEENVCRDTTSWSYERPYLKPTKEEFFEAIEVFNKTKELLKVGIKAQSKQCINTVQKHLPIQKIVNKRSDNLHVDFFGIQVASGHLNNCLTCVGESSILSCNLGLESLQEDEEYLNCVKDNYYH